MDDGLMNINEIDFNQDGITDLQVLSWSHQSYQTGTGVELQIISDVYDFKGFSTSSNHYINACPTNPEYYNSGYGYVFRSDINRPYTKDYVLLPFRFTIEGNIHFGVLHVLYESTTITIEGYNWHPQPLKSCDCQSSYSTSPSLEINVISETVPMLKYKYYNISGQELQAPKGIVLKVFENGQIEHLYYPD